MSGRKEIKILALYNLMPVGLQCTKDRSPFSGVQCLNPVGAQNVLLFTPIPNTYTTYIHTHIHKKHTHIHTHTQTHTHTNTHIHKKHTHIHTYKHTHTHTNTHIYTHIHIQTHTHKHTYIHTHTHTHTHTEITATLDTYHCTLSMCSFISLNSRYYVDLTEPLSVIYRTGFSV
jgi:hypothetical protein